MIEKKSAKDLMRKFGGMPSTPTLAADVDLRTTALRENAKSEAHASAVVTGLVGKLNWFPTVADIIQACDQVPDPAFVDNSHANCAECEGTGWLIVEKNGIEGAQRCRKGSK
jgi:hypothetical protein